MPFELSVYLLVRGEVNWPDEGGERKDPPATRVSNIPIQHVWTIQSTCMAMNFNVWLLTLEIFASQFEHALRN